MSMYLHLVSPASLLNTLTNILLQPRLSEPYDKTSLRVEVVSKGSAAVTSSPPFVGLLMLTVLQRFIRGR